MKRELEPGSLSQTAAALAARRSALRCGPALIVALIGGCDLDSANAQRAVRTRPTHAPPLVPLRSTSPLFQDVVEPDAPRTPPPIPTRAPTIVTRGRWTDVAPGMRVQRAVVRLDDDPQGPELQWITLRTTIAQVRYGAAATVTDQLGAVVRAPVRASVVAGFFERDKHPSGVLEAAGQVLGQHHLHAGSGIFVVRDGRARVVPASSPQSEWSRADLAVQCGPRLVEPGPVIGVYGDRGDRYARAAACVRDRGATVDFIVTWSAAEPLRGPGLLAFAKALAGPSPAGDETGCESALNLDGGPSAGIVVDRSEAGSHPAVGPVPWAIVLAAR